MNVACAAFWCSPDGPGVPFGPWPIWLFDELRLLCLAGGVATFALTVLALRHQAHGASWGQQSRWLASLMFTVVVMGTELEHIGDLASWRLLISLLALAGNLYGLLHLLRHEDPNQAR